MVRKLPIEKNPKIEDRRCSVWTGSPARVCVGSNAVRADYEQCWRRDTILENQHRAFFKRYKLKVNVYKTKANRKNVHNRLVRSLKLSTKWNILKSWSMIDSISINTTNMYARKQRAPSVRQWVTYQTLNVAVQMKMGLMPDYVNRNLIFNDKFHDRNLRNMTDFELAN